MLAGGGGGGSGGPNFVQVAPATGNKSGGNMSQH